MSLPLPDVSSVDLFQKLLTAKQSVVTDYPKKDADGKPLFPLQIVLLSVAETMACTAEAERKTQLAFKDLNQGVMSPGRQEFYNNASAIEILFRACRYVDNQNKPIFPSKEKMCEACTNDELGVLLNQYSLLQATSGPVISHMSESDFDAWVDKLTEGGTGIAGNFLGSFSWGALQTFIMHLVSRLQTLQTDKSLSILPQESTKTSETTEVADQ